MPITRNNYLHTNTVDIMPKTEGSGPEGTKQLLKLWSAPIGMMSAVSPIGRGVLGTLGTLSVSPTDSEAGFIPFIRSSAFKGRGKADAYGRRTLNRTIHMNDGSRISGMTSPDTFYGYSKNGEAFTIRAESLAKQVNNIVSDNKASNDFKDSIKKYLTQK